MAYTQFRHPNVPAIDAALESSNNGRPTLTVHPSASPHLMHDSPALPPTVLGHEQQDLDIAQLRAVPDGSPIDIVA